MGSSEGIKHFLTIYNNAAVAKARIPAKSAGVAVSALAMSEPMMPPAIIVHGKKKMIGSASHKGCPLREVAKVRPAVGTGPNGKSTGHAQGGFG